MAGSSEHDDGRSSEPRGEARAVPPAGPRPAVVLTVVAFVTAALWFFPLFRVVPLLSPESRTGFTTEGVAFDPVAVAAKLWLVEFPAAAQRAKPVNEVAAAVRADALAARQQHAAASGLGTAYYFVRGSGQVVSQDRNYVRVALDLPTRTVVALRIGPVFGNTVRDGSGLLDVNRVPGLQEFNALAAELNALVEKTVLPALRSKVAVGSTVVFAGCAEAPEAAPTGVDPLLVIVPVMAEVRE